MAEWESAGPPGGGGVNGLVAAKGNDLFQAYDVGGIQHIPADHPELAHKCNAGLANRHVASLSRTPSGKVLAGMGTIGPSGNGAQLFDATTHRWGTKIPGSQFIALMSQNSAPSGGSWPRWGIGHRYVRSVGELLALDEESNELTGGEFGMNLTAIGVTVVEPDGSPRTIKGTERFAVRNLIQDDVDRAIVYAATWPGGMYESPRGLWRIDTASDTVDRLLDRDVEGIAQRGNTIVAVTRTSGIYLTTDNGANWTDISANAPKGTWWRCASLLKNGTILIGGCFPVGGWAWARRQPNATEWENLSATVDNRDLTSGQAFVPPNAGNRMGATGCTIIDTCFVMFRGKLVPACSGAGGVAWLFLEAEGGCRPMAYGGGIVVNRDVVATPDGQHILLAMMDHKIQVSHDKGLTWEKEATGLGGPNDFNAVGLDGDRFIARGDDGSQWQATITDSLRWTQSSLDARKYNPASNRVGGSGNTVTLDGKDVSNGAVERFGAADVSKRHLTGGYLWVIGHGAIRLPV